MVTVCRSLFSFQQILCKQNFPEVNNRIENTFRTSTIFVFVTKKKSSSVRNQAESSDRDCRPNATVPKSLFNSVLYCRLGAKREENTMKERKCMLKRLMLLLLYIVYCYCEAGIPRTLRDARWDPERFLFVYTHLRRTWRLGEARTIADSDEMKHMSESDDRIEHRLWVKKGAESFSVTYYLRFYIFYCWCCCFSL